MVMVRLSNEARHLWLLQGRSAVRVLAIDARIVYWGGTCYAGDGKPARGDWTAVDESPE
jgi:hypothetical protein